MNEQLKLLLNTLAKFGEEELNEICDCFKRKVVKKNTILLQEGQICKEFYYIKQGAIRTYFITKQGSEKTRLINLDCSIGTAFTSFVTQTSSLELIDTLEDTELFVITHCDFYRLLTETIHWRDFYQRILEMAYTFQNRKIEQLVTMSAKQRYQLVLKENPKLIQRVSNKILASYIDIREETLSRIKTK
jgi:CRP-like cAMP-binding protein